MISYGAARNILAGSVSIFVDGEASQSTHYYTKDDFCTMAGDDPINIPDGKAVRVKFEYVDESEMDSNIVL